MKILFWTNIILLTIAWPNFAGGHEHEMKKSQVGEFYEYDIEGSHSDQVKREVGYHTKQVIKAPFKFVGKCYRTSKSAIKGALHSIELFLSDSRSINGKRQNFKNAVSDFEGSAAFNDYYNHENDREGSHCMFGAPNALWKVFKNFLYTAGFVFPRETWIIMKSIFHGTCACVNG